MGEINYKQFQKRYKLTLTTVGPVFVGSGEKTGARDYIIINNGKSIFLPDMGKLYLSLGEQQKDKFEKYLGSNDNDQKRLGTFLKEIGIVSIPETLRSNKYFAKTSEGINQTIDWRISPDSENANGKQRPIKHSDINLCVLDPLTQQAYIPGSSLKGVIRGILIAKFLREDQELIKEVCKKMYDCSNDKDVENISSKLDRNVNNLLRNRFTKEKTKIDDAVNDLMQSIVVSDSELVPRSSLILCKKFDEIAIKGRASLRRIRTTSANPMIEANPHEINTETVCIKPQTDIKFDISVNQELWSKYFPDCDFADFIEEIKRQYTDLFNNYLSKFQNKTDVGNNANIIYVGGGVGFLQKTIWGSFPSSSQLVSKIVQKILNIEFDDKDGTKSRDHKNMGHTPWNNGFVEIETWNAGDRIKCQCGKSHRHNHGFGCPGFKGANCHETCSDTIKVDDFQDFGACPRCLKLTKFQNSFYEMGKCKIEIKPIQEP